MCSSVRARAQPLPHQIPYIVKQTAQYKKGPELFSHLQERKFCVFGSIQGQKNHIQVHAAETNEVSLFFFIEATLF